MLEYKKSGDKGISFDPETQEVEWYVIKFRGYDEERNMTYNVDGVIKDKAKYWVAYFPNGGDANVPTKKQYAKDVNVAVEFSTIPSRAGYTFLGWDENANATTPTYKQGDTTADNFTMPDRDVTLYAIWQANDATKYTVNHYFAKCYAKWL